MTDIINIVFYASIPVIIVAGVFCSFLWGILLSDIIETIKEDIKERRKKKNGTICRHCRE